MSESHYNVPRSIHAAQASAASSAVQPMPAGVAVNSGIYSVPSSLLASDVSNTFSIQGQSFSLSGDPYAQYDVPRPLSLIPDEEAIYDYPENVVDMEIYDYPPDALSLLPPPPDMCPLPPESSHNSVATLTSDFSLSARSSLAAPDDWSHITLPPPPVSLSSSRPSVAISTTSSDEYSQVQLLSLHLIVLLCCKWNPTYSWRVWFASCKRYLFGELAVWSVVLREWVHCGLMCIPALQSQGLYHCLAYMGRCLWTATHISSTCCAAFWSRTGPIDFSWVHASEIGLPCCGVRLDLALTYISVQDICRPSYLCTCWYIALPHKCSVLVHLSGWLHH